MTLNDPKSLPSFPIDGLVVEQHLRESSDKMTIQNVYQALRVIGRDASRETDSNVLQTIEWIVGHYIAPEDSESWQPAIIVTAALFEGPDVKRIAHLTGYSRDYIELIATRMRNSGLWTDNDVDYDEWFEANMGFGAYFLDIMVAKGMLVRTNAMKNGKHCYKASPATLARQSKKLPTRA